MKKSILKLIAALSLVLTFTACTITVVESDGYSLDYSYRYSSWCEDAVNCKDDGGSSYVRVTGDLTKDNVVSIEIKLPGAENPYYKEDFRYKGIRRDESSDELGPFYYFEGVGTDDALYVYYEVGYAYLEGFWDDETDDMWAYGFSNDKAMFKKAANKVVKKARRK